MQSPLKYKYNIFGLSCESELEFKHLNMDERIQQPDIKIRLGTTNKILNATQIGVNAYINTSELWLEIKNIVTFLVNKNQIIINKHYLAENQDIMPFLFSTAFAYLLYQRKYLLLSGSAVSINNQIYLICSNSSNGKSSLAASLAKYYGYSIISDGLLVITESTVEKKLCIIQNQLPLNLWQDSCEKLDIPYTDLEQTRPKILKYQLLNKPLFGLHQNEYLNINLKINYILQLCIHNHHEPIFKETSGKEKIDFLLGLSLNRSLIEHNKSQIKHNFEQVVALANQVNTISVTRPYKFSYSKFANIVHEKLNSLINNGIK